MILNTLELQPNGRFKLNKEQKEKILQKRPRPKNMAKKNFSCGLSEKYKLMSGKYDYVIYSDNEVAYLFDAKDVGQGAYVEYGQNYRRSTQLYYVGKLIKEGKYLEKRVL